MSHRVAVPGHTKDCLHGCSVVGVLDNMLSAKGIFGAIALPEQFCVSPDKE